MAIKLDDEQQAWFVKTLQDPAGWAEAFLKNPDDPQKSLTFRSYQRDVLENTRKFKNMILRMGRRSGKSVTLCADVLWWTTAHPLVRMFEEGGTRQVPCKALILTPMDAQIKMLFDTLLALCADSPYIQDMVTKIKRSDVSEIHFTNGSVIKGMTIGISSANKGLSARGQCLSADTMVHMSNGSLKSIVNVKINDSVLCIDNHDRITKSMVTNVFKPEYKTIYEIKLRSGKSIKCSSEHKLYGHRNHQLGTAYSLSWGTLSNYKVGDYLTSQNNKQFYKYKNLIINDLHLDKILSIRKIGKEITYDISVDKYHNFIANGLVVHNSCDYLFLDEMDYIPRQVMEQAILPLTSTNRNCKQRVCSTPSGKRELFYEYATKHKELGWYHAHIPSWHPGNPSWISIQECKDTGRPIHESTEYQYKSVTDNNSYMREYGAEFGEELHGVYKHELINKSLVVYSPEYRSEDTSVFNPGFDQTPGNIYILGVDWNSYVNGGQIVMLEYCQEPTTVSYFSVEDGEITLNFTNKFRLFYRKGIKSEEGTQRGTREEIIRLLRTYKIDHLYVDYGYGDTNIEELTYYGKENPGLSIARKLHVIDSGSNIEHYDPVLQKKIKKRAKSLMINTSVVSLEEGRMMLPKEEDGKQRLIDQMRNYVVKSVTAKGDYTYDGEDHILDAFNLAVYGFYHQYSLLLNTRYENKIKFMNNPRYDDVPKRQQKVETTILKSEKQFRDPELAPRYNVPRHIHGSKRSRASNFFGSGFRKQL